MIPLWPYTIVLKKDFWNLHRPSSSACRSHIAGRNAQWGPNLDCSLQPRLIMGGNQKNGISQDPPYRPYRNAEKGFSVSKQYERTFKPPRVSKQSSNHQKHTFRIQGWAVLTILHQGKHAMHSGQVLELHGWSMDWFSESNMISILRIQLVLGISWNIMEVGTLFSEANYWIFDANILTLSKSTTQEGSGPPKIRYTYVTAFNLAYSDAFSYAKLCVVTHFL